MSLYAVSPVTSGETRREVPQVSPITRLHKGTTLIIGKPFPFVSACVEAIDEAIGPHTPGQGMSTLQRAWLSFCRTAILVTTSSCGARFARASLGPYSLAALSWMCRHAKIPWEHLLVVSVRVILEHHGITSGSLVIDDTDKKRAKSAKTLAHLYKLRDKERGGYIWGQSLVFLGFVTSKLTIPMGFAFYQPAPELSAWYKHERLLQQQGVAKAPRPPTPPAKPQYPTKHDLALHLLPQCKAHSPALHVPCMTADALYGTAAFVDAASAMFGGGQVLSQLRSHQTVRLYKRQPHVSDYCVTPPGPPHNMRIRGGEDIVAVVGSARLYVCAHNTKRCIIAIKSEGEETSRSLMASDLSWPTLDMVQAHTLRWLVEVFVQDWKAHEGWNQLTKQPGDEGARRSVILSLLGDPWLFCPPDQHARLKNNLPAYTVGSLRANVQVQCLVDVIQSLLLSDAPKGPLQRFTPALHEVFAFGRSTKHLIQRQLGRLEPTPSLKDRADEVMKNMPSLST